MDNEIADKEYLKEVSSKLCSDHGGTVRGTSIIGIECQGCNRDSAYTFTESPMKIWCNHKNSCGGEFTHADYFPGLQNEVYKRFGAKSPTDTALSYARYTRGLPNFEKWGGKPVRRKILKEFVDALQFDLANPGGESVTNFRMINHSTETSCTWGKKSNAMWIPAIPLDFTKPLALAESPIKAMGLLESDIQAISVVSAGCRPEYKSWLLQNKDKISCLILAFDNDPAGHKATRIWAAWCEANNIPHEIAFPRFGDWDDMNKAQKLNLEAFNDCKLLGRLFTAKDEKEAGELQEDHFGVCPKVFTWRGETWRAVYHKDTEPPELKTVQCLIAGTIRPSHSFHSIEPDGERRTVNKVEFVFPEPKAEPVLLKLTGKDLSSPQNLNEKLLTTVRTHFEGSKGDIPYLSKNIIQINRMPNVYQYDRYGYHPQSGAYIFANFAVDKEGQLFRLNRKSYFDKINIAPMTCEESNYHIDEYKQCQVAQIISHIKAAFGVNGLIALGFYVSTYFSSSTIFPEYGHFPLLSLNGAKNRGKSTLAKFLNCLFLLENREGYVQKKSSTVKSFNRILARLNSLPVVFLEGNDAEKINIDENDLLSIFNREPLQSRANKSQDNTINELFFDAAFVCVQNVEPFTQGAVKQRFITLPFKENGGRFTPEEKVGYNALKTVSLENRAWFGLSILRDRKYYEDKILNYIQKCSDRLTEQGVEVDRIRNNFAIALGGLEALISRAFDGDKAAGTMKVVSHYAAQLAIEKQNTSENNSDQVDHFLNAFEELSRPVPGQGGLAPLEKGAHYIQSGDEIHIRVSEAFRVMQAYNYGCMMDLKDLTRELRLHPSFVSYGMKSSSLWKRRKQERAFTLKKEFLHLSDEPDLAVV